IIYLPLNDPKVLSDLNDLKKALRKKRSAWPDEPKVTFCQFGAGVNFFGTLFVTPLQNKRKY
ncbi:MAG: hypothetical protein K2J09_06485, partial [Muribaculaceae bacterium]|nr:hypothetical protein [Muribaculaceae bacterium]